MTEIKVKYYVYRKYYNKLMSGQEIIRWDLVAILDSVKDLEDHIKISSRYKEDIKIQKHIIAETIEPEVILSGISKFITLWKLKLKGLKL